ncbi:MAG: UDP-N-acetylglucosamine 2-epimerase [Deltaproteobacteria bacterium]|nr:UDP-N-acetylglucosamine 2-epimerase [Deltaproteobacteria bacterium]
MNKRKIAVILVDRANYGRLKPVMEAVKRNDDLALQVVCAGTMVLERFGAPVNIVRTDGFDVSSEIYIELEGSTPLTMAKSLGFAVIEFASEFQRLRPDIVLIIGDRYEALAAALAASYMNICIAHIQGGEVSGSIDESARHAITKLAHFHFPSTRKAAEHLKSMGERPETVFFVGCPSGDIALKLNKELPFDIFARGVGGEIAATDKYLLVVFHPVTTEYGMEKDETLQLITALGEIKMPTVWLWPNIDAGSDHVSKVIRAFREQREAKWLRLIKNFTPENYLKVLANASCAIGNSSSFVRDSSFLGTPVVLVGDRQGGREVAENVLPVAPERTLIFEAVKKQLGKGGFTPSSLYGDGTASGKIAAALSQVVLYIQKRLAYL